ncbi:MAG: hypothetical protein U0795_02135 [Pirellulales bacterium]
MNRSAAPYLGSCHFCGQGLLRFWQCGQCGTVLAMCDECELIWRDLTQVSREPATKADGVYPMCPVCRSASRHWIRPGEDDLAAAGLEPLVKGWSV